MPRSRRLQAYPKLSNNWKKLAIQLENAPYEAIALPPSLGQKVVEPTGRDAPLKPNSRLKCQEPDRERFRGNTDIAFAGSVPIFTSGRVERLQFGESLSEIFGHRDFTATALALGRP
jgi:hypothetical protein